MLHSEARFKNNISGRNGGFDFRKIVYFLKTFYTINNF
jgi:hypothetical protein